MRQLIEQLKFDDLETEKMEFEKKKTAIDVNKVYIEKILASNEYTYDKTKQLMQNTLHDIKLVKKIDQCSSHFHK